MNPNSNAILTLCSHLCVGDGVLPLEPKEYSEFAQLLLQAGKKPEDLFEMSRAQILEQLNIQEAFADRIMRLIDRNASLCFELEQLHGMGIEPVTRADNQYPTALKKKLSESCPPIFYCAGDLSLLNQTSMGFVGARTIEQRDMDFTIKTVNKIVSQGYGVVSGGAKGVDTISTNAALAGDSFAIEYLSDSMLKKLRKNEIVKAIQNRKLVLLSVVKPDAGFNVGIAMMRNRYVYAQSKATIVVRSDLNKGGTWAGAVENIKHNWCPTLCWDYPYPGNAALIEKGAVAINDTWDGTVSETHKETKTTEQLSLFD